MPKFVSARWFASIDSIVWVCHRDQDRRCDRDRSVFMLGDLVGLEVARFPIWGFAIPITTWELTILTRLEIWIFDVLNSLTDHACNSEYPAYRGLRSLNA